MPHLHNVYDTDLHFSIDPISRVITNQTPNKVIIIQSDHNSERFTFEIPRLVDGHDMSLCNKVQVHYINIGTNERNTGVYDVTDLQLSPDDENVVICSWLISQNATKLVGSLNFVVRFACMTGDKIDYNWNTAVHSGIGVATGIDNLNDVVEQHADVLENWYMELISSGVMGVNIVAEATDNAKAVIEEATDNAKETIKEAAEEKVEDVKSDIGDHVQDLAKGLEEHAQKLKDEVLNTEFVITMNTSGESILLRDAIEQTVNVKVLGDNAANNKVVQRSSNLIDIRTPFENELYGPQVSDDGITFTYCGLTYHLSTVDDVVSVTGTPSTASQILFYEGEPLYKKGKLRLSFNYKKGSSNTNFLYTQNMSMRFRGYTSSFVQIDSIALKIDNVKTGITLDLDNNELIIDGVTKSISELTLINGITSWDDIKYWAINVARMRDKATNETFRIQLNPGDEILPYESGFYESKPTDANGQATLDITRENVIVEAFDKSTVECTYLANAENYVEGKVDEVRSYVDTKEAELREYANDKETELKTYADTAEADAKSYADTKDTALKAELKTYADTAEADAKSYADTKDSALLTSLTNGTKVPMKSTQVFAEIKEIVGNSTLAFSLGETLSESTTYVFNIVENGSSITDRPSYTSILVMPPSSANVGTVYGSMCDNGSNKCWVEYYIDNGVSSEKNKLGICVKDSKTGTDVNKGYTVRYYKLASAAT